MAFLLPYMGSIIMGGIFAGTIAQQGVDAGENADNLRKNIQLTNEKTKIMQNAFDKVIKGDAKLEGQMENDINNGIDQIGQAQAQMAIDKRNFDDKYKKIQVTGVVFVVTLFFLLLLKKSGLLDWLFNFSVSSTTAKTS